MPRIILGIKSEINQKAKRQIIPIKKLFIPSVSAKITADIRAVAIVKAFNINNVFRESPPDVQLCRCS
jgi:hypothetical protein